jgi:hypothetical protein
LREKMPDCRAGRALVSRRAARMGRPSESLIRYLIKSNT